MRAAKCDERPEFLLLKQTDIENQYYMQMPLWLFSDPRYADLSLDAKVTYTFLRNRFQLSRRKGWLNKFGEVFVIFPRLALAHELRICEKRVTAAFRELVQAQLVWEKRCGLGQANQIYLAKVEPQCDPDYECAPFLLPEGDFIPEIEAETEDAFDAVQEPPNRRFCNGGNGGSGTAEMAVQEPPILRSRKNEKKKIEESKNEVSQSVTACADGQTDEEEELMGILDACELYSFPQETAKVFENAIERLFYSDSFRIGNATLPKSRVRSKLHLLDGMVLREAESKLAANLEQNVKNSTAYTMSTIFNCIAEFESDLLVDPYLNSLRAPPGRR